MFVLNSLGHGYSVAVGIPLARVPGDRGKRYAGPDPLQPLKLARRGERLRNDGICRLFAGPEIRASAEDAGAGGAAPGPCRSLASRSKRRPTISICISDSWQLKIFLEG